MAQGVDLDCLRTSSNVSCGGCKGRSRIWKWGFFTYIRYQPPHPPMNGSKFILAVEQSLASPHGLDDKVPAGKECLEKGEFVRIGLHPQERGALKSPAKPSVHGSAPGV